MDGSKRRAGAVAAAPNLAAPVIVARAMLERGEQVVMAGPGALNFAHEIGLDPVKEGALVTPQAQQRCATCSRAKPHADGGGVGAVARDKNGHFAAATSTGGTIGRRPGVVDDASIPGVGTWADETCAIVDLRRRGAVPDRARPQHRAAGQQGRVAAHRDEARAAGAEGAVPDALAGAIAVDKNSWSALQMGPAMPCAWIDDFGPNEAAGFEL